MFLSYILDYTLILKRKSFWDLMANHFGKCQVFGTDAENYVSRLFMMMNNPNGSRRPDLVSINGRFKPKLSLEVKSGKSKKGILTKGQLHYAITCNEDYEELFGEPKRSYGLFEDEDLTIEPPKDIAYYYDLIFRTDGMTAKELKGSFGSIKCTWGDQYIVPHEFGFHQFAAGVSIRTGWDMDEVIPYLRRTIKQQALGGEIDYEDERADSQYWQNLHGIDIMAVYNNDMSLTSKKGIERIGMMKDNYEEMDDLERIQIPGPNGSNIYVLANPKDYDLFDVQLRNTVEERGSFMEEVSRQRKESAPLLKKRHVIDVYGNPMQDDSSLTTAEISDLERLIAWLPEGEDVLDEIPF